MIQVGRVCLREGLGQDTLNSHTSVSVMAINSSGSSILHLYFEISSPQKSLCLWSIWILRYPSITNRRISGVRKMVVSKRVVLADVPGQLQITETRVSNTFLEVSRARVARTSLNLWARAKGLQMADSKRWLEGAIKALPQLSLTVGH